MDPAFYQQVLDACFPDLHAGSMRFLGGGSCRVFLVNGDEVFRFPHDPEADAALRRERTLYDWLAPRLPAAVPRYTWFGAGCPAFPHPVAGYHSLPGVPLESTPGTATPAFARSLGRFLTALHGLQPPDALPLQTDVGGPDRMRDVYGRLCRLAFPALTPAERDWTEAVFESFLDDPSLCSCTPVLVHGDLNGSNILCDPSTGMLTGVIDFEDAGLGDPAGDFCALQAELGAAFVTEMLSSYDRPVDVGFQGRIAARARIVLFHELLYGIEYGEPGAVAHGRERLRRAMAGAAVIGGWRPVSTAAGRTQPGYPP